MKGEWFPMFTQASVNNMAIDGAKFVNNSVKNGGGNLNWGMYTVADMLVLLEWHIEYSPATRKQAKHIHKWLTYHAIELSGYWYEFGFEDEGYPQPDRVTRMNINNANINQFAYNTDAEKHYLAKTCEWLNKALDFMFVHPRPERTENAH